VDDFGNEHPSASESKQRQHEKDRRWPQIIAAEYPRQSRTNYHKEGDPRAREKACHEKDGK